MSSGVDRSALINAAARVQNANRINCTGPGEVGCGGVEGWHSWGDHYMHVSEAMLDAVLPMIAQAIEAEADCRKAAMQEITGIARSHDSAVGCGVRVAARLVRSLGGGQ